MSKMHFSCTSCGRCCHDLRLTLSVHEAIQWLQRGGKVEILCHAAPVVGDDGLVETYRSARSFSARSGDLPIRVQIILAAHFEGACPNLLPDMRCGIYQERPNVCRIYPAEINPGMSLSAGGKLCPPEAWSNADPTSANADVATFDNITEDAIKAAQAAGLHDVALGKLLMAKLGVDIAALENEGFAVWPVRADQLVEALLSSVADHEGGLASSRLSSWRFISARPSTVQLILSAGAEVVSEIEDGGVNYLPLY